jgi:phosphoribosylamine--glycine ligase
MNIAVLGSTSSYHYLSQTLEKESTVYHFGAPAIETERNNYVPIPKELPPDNAVDVQMSEFLEYSKDIKLDFVMAAGLPIPLNNRIHEGLKERNIPYLFVNPDITALERNKYLTKQLLAKLNIPTPGFKKVDGKYLFDNFKDIPRPFVVKLCYTYQYGKQTIVVKDDNWQEAYEDLFSLQLFGDYKITNITYGTVVILEDYIDLKYEYSYHALYNRANWKYLGSGRDYKKLNEGDTGPNTAGLGCYNINEVSQSVHEYADKIYNFLKEYLAPKNDYYKGFIFLGIGVDRNDIPYILEINTRSGDPELQTILGSIENNLSDLFYAASADLPIPDVKHNNKSTVTVRVFNRTYDWTRPASFLPKFENIPDDIVHSIEGSDKFYLKHSVFTTTANTREEAATKIYQYLDTQHIGQFTYRRDIGLLK